MVDAVATGATVQHAPWRPSGPPPPVRWALGHPQVVDTVIAVVLAIAAVGSVVAHTHQTGEVRPGLFVLALATSVPLIARRRAPLAVLVVVVAAQVGLELAGADGPGWLAALLAGYTFTSRSATMTPRRILLCVGAAVVPVAVAALAWGHNPVMFVPGAVFLALVMIVGDRVRRGRELSREIVDQAAERQRSAAELALQDERRRIARELHDVVAHSVSVMVIQAAAARRQLATDPARATAALVDVEETGRTAMHEMRRVLGVLRGDDPAGTMEPQPGVASLADLVDSTTDLPVRLRLPAEDELADVPQAVAVSAYRVVQEALTNVRRHAGVVHAVEVTVQRVPGALVVEVLDDGRGASVAAAAGGFGLVGMRERVGMFAGQLVAGPRPGGGWRVRATLPT